MKDDFFNAAPATKIRRVQRHVELVWEFVRADLHRVECELQFKGESRGWLAMIYMDGSPLGGQRFVLRADAIRWAQEERLALDLDVMAPHTAGA